MSFIQMIIPANGSHTGYFYNQPVDVSFRQSNPMVQLRFLLGQAITLNYLGRVYGNRDITLAPGRIPNFIAEYVVKLQDYIDEFNSQNYSQLKDKEFNYDLIFRNILNLLRDREQATITTGCEEMITFLDKDCNACPIPCSRNFYVPYLKWLCASSKSDIKADFTVDHIVSIPQFFYNGNVIVEEDITIGTEYNYSYVGTRQFSDNPHSLGATSIFAYLRGYNWTASTSNGVIGLLANYGSLELDMTNVDPLSNLRAFYDVHRLMDLKPSTSNDIEFKMSYESVLHFLVDIFYRFKIKIDDAVVLGRFVNHTNPDTQLLKDYLNGNTVDSAKSQEVFKRSTLRDLVGCESMNIIDDSYSTTSLDTTKTPLYVDAKPDPNKDKEDGDQQEDPKEEKEDNLKDTPEGDTESTSTDSPEDQDQTMDQDDQDSTDEKEKGVDDAEPEDTESKDEETEDEESDKSQNQVHTQSVPKPKLPGLNLKRGINMELASNDEDIDTFLYRKEVESFIDNVLANPNHLSVPQQEALKKIKTQFLYTLNVQSLYNLLKKTVA